MATPVIGIPTTRVSDLFIRQRLLQQVQYDQAEIFRVQTQLATGHRFQTPSEDPVAAMRVVSLQSLLERKQQVMANLNTNQSFLSATDTALSNISNIMADVRGTTLSVLGTTATDVQRQAAALQVQQALQQLSDAGNQLFRGRYLFAGSTTTATPFVEVGTGYAQYDGNELTLSSYADVDLLFNTNLTGAEAFGALSDPVRGTVNLNPVLNYDTRVADLRGGQGLSRGSIAVSDGTRTSVIDLSQAETVGDLAALIQAHPPAGRALQVEITPERLIITLDSSAGGNLAISEVGGGTLADELGILQPIGSGKTVAGRDLDPVLRKTAALKDVLGVRARAVVRGAGPDNDFILEADHAGAALPDGRPLNGVKLTFVNDPLVVPGQETVVYGGGSSIVVHIAAGFSQTQQVLAAINAAHDAGTLPFTARLDPLDQLYGGTSFIDVGATGTTAYGAGEDFDRTGLQIVNRGQTFNIAFTLAETVEDVLNTLNGAGAGVLAEINAAQTGMDLRSRCSGCDFAIGENGGETARQLGLRSFTAATRLADLNFGRGVDSYAGSDDVDFTITRADGAPLAVKVGGATTIQDILDLINNHPQNADGKLVARLALRGNGIELADDSQGSGTLRVTRSQMSTAAIDLGLVPAGANNSLPAAADGHAATTIASTAKKSGLVFSAVASGTAANGVRVVLQDGGPAAPAYDGLTKTLTIGITAGVTRAADVAAMLAASPLGATFAAGFDPADNSGNDGTGTVAATDPLDPPTTAGGTATAYAAATVASAGYDNDLILTARNVGTAQNDIQIRFIEVPGGPTAVASYTPGLELVFQIDPGVSTANDVIAALAAHPAANADFAAALDPADASPNDGSGLVDATTGAEPAMSGGQQTLAGTDVNPRETDSLFTALVRIRDGLQADDLFLVQRSLDLLERKVVDLNFSRAGLGAQQQGLDVLRDRLDTEDVELQQSLSLDYDADLAAVVTDLSSRQAAFEAALQATARTYGMSLLNYL